MSKLKRNKDRCDKCGKWVVLCQLMTLPESLYKHLEYDNEFSVCEQCTATTTREKWIEWICYKRSARK
jgi:uncharacterized protein with PIN domain